MAKLVTVCASHASFCDRPPPVRARSLVLGGEYAVALLKALCGLQGSIEGDGPAFGVWGIGYRVQG